MDFRCFEALDAKFRGFRAISRPEIAESFRSMPGSCLEPQRDLDGCCFDRLHRRKQTESITFPFRTVPIDNSVVCRSDADEGPMISTLVGRCSEDPVPFVIRNPKQGYYHADCFVDRSLFRADW